MTILIYKKFNNQRIKSSYYKTYTICNNTLDMSTVNADENGIIYNDNTTATDALEKLFHVAYLYVEEMMLRLVI